MLEAILKKAPSQDRKHFKINFIIVLDPENMGVETL